MKPSTFRELLAPAFSGTARAVLVTVIFCACGPRVEAFSAASADPSITGSSVLPVALEPDRVGTYSGEAKSGAGYFYDQVLEYRVWLHPERGAEPIAGNNDYFAAFAEYERAVAFSKTAKGAEEPIVLIRQLEWIDEPSPGQYIVRRGDRITEWQVGWLAGSQRGANTIREFLANPRLPRE